jgi:heme o synthase
MRFAPRISFANQVFSAALAMLALTLTGWASGMSNASTSCIGWPLCRPNEALGWLTLLHRLAAAITGFLVILVARSAWGKKRHHLVILPLTTVSTILFFGQVFIGALEASNPAVNLKVLHALSTATLWICLGVLLVVSRLPDKKPRSDTALSVPRKMRDFLILTKPWIVALLLVTTMAGMVMGTHGLPPLPRVLWTLLGGALAAGGSSALNQYIDRELDRHMQRTANRPLAANRLTQAEGLAFGLGLCIASYYILAGLVNLLAAVLSLTGIFYYVLIYSLWLKKVTVQNIVIGGGAGAIPPMVGWAAATGTLPLAAWILFAMIFIWTPPHFWALALVRKKDYERAGVPMLPVIRGDEETRKQILLYTLLLVGVSLLLPALHLAGSLYFVSAFTLGSALLYAAWRVWRVPGNKAAFLMYRWSSFYLLFIFIALMLDAVVRHG